MCFSLFVFYRRAENEQAVSAALTDGQESACSISLYVVQIQISMLYSVRVCLIVSRSVFIFYEYMLPECE